MCSYTRKYSKDYLQVPGSRSEEKMKKSKQICSSLKSLVSERSSSAQSLQSCLSLYDPMDRSPPGSSVLGGSPGKSTGVGGRALLQGIFPTQDRSRVSYISCIAGGFSPLAPPGKPKILANQHQLSEYSYQKCSLIGLNRTGKLFKQSACSIFAHAFLLWQVIIINKYRHMNLREVTVSCDKVKADCHFPSVSQKMLMAGGDSTLLSG